MRRKIESEIKQFLTTPSNKILLIDGARQIGKTYIIRYVGKEIFTNYVEINLQADSTGSRMFANVRSVTDFYTMLGTFAGNKLGKKGNTLVFLDEIQTYPVFLTLLKFLKDDDRYTYICSGSLLGVTLLQTPSIPIGSIETLQMYPLDFEEFLWANGFSEEAVSFVREQFLAQRCLDEALHQRMMTLFREYLLTGGLPDAINSYLSERNVMKLRRIQTEIHRYYGADASRYDAEHKLKIQSVFQMIPSNLENKKKRVVVKDIENKVGKQFSDYQDEFDYLVSSGIALEVKAISNPKFPLVESARKNLLKLYLNDVGLLTNILYKHNIRPILEDTPSINLGSVYESVVAQELRAHGHDLFYYDNKQRGEVDFLIDDYDQLSVLPIEVKSGKDYKLHVALTHFTQTPEYHINKGIALSNNRQWETKGKVVYMPVYFAMFL